MAKPWTSMRNPPLELPVRAVPGGWRDVWDDPDDHAELRAQAEAAERRLMSRALVLGVLLQDEVQQERLTAERDWSRRRCTWSSRAVD